MLPAPKLPLGYHRAPLFSASSSLSRPNSSLCSESAQDRLLKPACCCQGRTHVFRCFLFSDILFCYFLKSIRARGFHQTILPKLIRAKTKTTTYEFGDLHFFHDTSTFTSVFSLTKWRTKQKIRVQFRTAQTPANQNFFLMILLLPNHHLFQKEPLLKTAKPSSALSSPI